MRMMLRLNISDTSKQCLVCFYWRSTWKHQIAQLPYLMIRGPPCCCPPTSSCTAHASSARNWRNTSKRDALNGATLKGPFSAASTKEKKTGIIVLVCITCSNNMWEPPENRATRGICLGIHRNSCLKFWGSAIRFRRRERTDGKCVFWGEFRLGQSSIQVLFRKMKKKQKTHFAMKPHETQSNMNIENKFQTWNPEEWKTCCSESSGFHGVPE